MAINNVSVNHIVDVRLVDPPRLPPGRGRTKPRGSEARVMDREGLQALVGRSSCDLIN